jgi:hypothetical protein
MKVKIMITVFNNPENESKDHDNESEDAVEGHNNREPVGSLHQ